MRQVWQTKDGDVFETEDQAAAHEALLDEIDALVETVLPRERDTCAFANNDEGPIELTQEQVENFLCRYLELVEEHCSKREYEMAKEEPRGFVGRYLSDGESPLYRLYDIYCRIDRKNCLWGQQYYTNQANGFL